MEGRKLVAAMSILLFLTLVMSAEARDNMTDIYESPYLAFKDNDICAFGRGLCGLSCDKGGPNDKPDTPMTIECIDTCRKYIVCDKSENRDDNSDWAADYKSDNSENGDDNSDWADYKSERLLHWTDDRSDNKQLPDWADYKSDNRRILLTSWFMVLWCTVVYVKVSRAR